MDKLIAIAIALMIFFIGASAYYANVYGCNTQASASITTNTSRSLSIATNTVANTAATASVVNEDDKLLQTARNLRAKPLTIYFNSSNQLSKLDANEQQTLDDLAYYLQKTPEHKIIITGHTDSRGRLKNNIRLGRKRAEFLRDYLVEKGIAKDQIKTASMASEMPQAPNNNSNNRAKNRRAEIIF